MFRKILAAAVACLTLTLGLSLATSPAHADVPGLEIGTIGYNARGADVEGNRNNEYVDIANKTNSAINVKDLLVRDSWAKGQNTSEAGACNTFKVTDLPGVEETADEVMLPAGHVIRVYSGAGTPKTFGFGNKWHAVYKNSTCGYNGHFWNNLGDTVWITLGSGSESKRYDFRFGYYVR